MSQPVKHIKVYKNSMALLTIYTFTDWAIKARIIPWIAQNVRYIRHDSFCYIIQNLWI